VAIIASVSDTGVDCEPASAVGAAALGLTGAAAATGSALFCRTARYAPPPAAVTHPAAIRPAARVFEIMVWLLDTLIRAIAVPRISA
jgi:hypothetical protein